MGGEGGAGAAETGGGAVHVADVAARLRAATEYFAVGFFLLAVGFGWTWRAWDRDSRRALDAALAEVHAAGLELRPDDYLPTAVPPEQNAARLYLEACARIPVFDRYQRFLLERFTTTPARSLDRDEVDAARRLAAATAAAVPGEWLAQARACRFCVLDCDFEERTCRGCPADKLRDLLLLLVVRGGVAAYDRKPRESLTHFRDALGLLRVFGTNPCLSRRAKWAGAVTAVVQCSQFGADPGWNAWEWESLLELLPRDDTAHTTIERAARVCVARRLRHLQEWTPPRHPLPGRVASFLGSGVAGRVRAILGRPWGRFHAAEALGWWLYGPDSSFSSLDQEESATAALVLARAALTCELHWCRTGAYPEAASTVRLRPGWSLTRGTAPSRLDLSTPGSIHMKWNLQH